MTEPPNRANLKALLEQRVADWRQRLRSEHPEEARFVVQQLIGPITPLGTVSVKDLPEWVQNMVVEDDGTDTGGHDEVSFEDCGFAAVATPHGLANGICALNMVAGACNPLNLEFSWTAA